MLEEAPASGLATSMTDVPSEEIGAELAQEERWEELIALLLERSEAAAHGGQRLGCLKRAAEVFEKHLVDNDKAYITLQAAFAEDFSNREVAEELTRLAAVLGRQDELVSEYLELAAEQADPGQKVQLYLQVATWQEQAGETEARIETLKKAQLADPGSQVVGRLLAEWYTAQEQWRPLAEHLGRVGRATQGAKDRQEFLLLAADTYYRRVQDMAEATQLYAEVLEHNPDSVAALEMLSDISWKEENWARTQPLLARMADSPQRSNAERSSLHQKAASAALRTGADEAAKRHVREILALDPEPEVAVREWLDVVYSRQWWPEVRDLALWLREQAKPLDEPPAQAADLLVRLGKAHLELGDGEKALEALKEAISVEPSHRKGREFLAEALTRSGDSSAAFEHKAFLATALDTSDQKLKLLLEVGRTARTSLKDPERALAALAQARTIAPGDRALKGEVLELHTELGHWKEASALLMELADEEQPPARARYLAAAATILHYELKASEQALTLLERVLDDDPTDVKAIERIEKILTAKGAWRELALAYRRMIKRLGTAAQGEGRAVLLRVWRGLGQICRTHLRDRESAIAALEVCVELDPGSLAEQEALAELYEASGPERFGDVVRRRTHVFDKSADAEVMVRQLRALRRLYAQANQWDRVFCVCAALTVLQAANAEELALYERVAAAPLALPQAALTEELWQKVLYDPAEERRLSLLFSCVSPVVMLQRAQEARAVGIREPFVLEPATDPSGLARLFELGAAVLHVTRPPLFLNPDFAGDLNIANVREASGPRATVVVGPNIANGRVERDLAFIVGRTLALVRPEHLVLAPSVVASPAELAGIVLAAYKLCKANAAVPNPALYQPYLEMFHRLLPPQALEPLSSLIPWLNQNLATLDLEGWRAAAEKTADRAGLLLCGDLGAAVRMIHASRGPAASASVIDLVRFSVSETYLGLRDLLGLSASATG